MKFSTFILLFIFLLLASCSEGTNNYNKRSLKDSFFIQLTFEREDELTAVKERLQNNISDTILTVNDNKLLIGTFNSYRIASDRGFELFADNMIDEFKIFHNDSTLSHDYIDFYFVGNDLGRPALYKTSLTDVQPKLVWSKWGREIIKLSPHKLREEYFFTTCLTKGIRGSFPYVWDARLYRVSSGEDNIRLLQKLGKGLTLQSKWESDSAFSAYFTILDSVVTSTVIQKKYNYSITGEAIDTTEQIYELVSDGIPFVKYSQIETISPDHRYKLKINNEDTLRHINILDELNGSIHRITELEGEIKSSKWNEVGDYLFITEDFDTPKDSTSLLIIDMRDQILQKKISGYGEKNFVIVGNLLLYDDEFDENSSITMYRYRKDEIYATIKIPGGCGIYGIPQRGMIN